MLFPEPSRFSSPDATNLRRAPSIELMLSEGQSSRISCFVKQPILLKDAFRTVSSAGSFVSTSSKRSSKSLYAERTVPSRYLNNLAEIQLALAEWMNASVIDRLF